MSWESNEILATVTECYPSQLFGNIELRWVLVAGDPRYGDYAAYVGEGTPEYVRSCGTKISFDHATRYFCDLERDRYRGPGGYETLGVEQRIVDCREGVQSDAESD